MSARLLVRLHGQVLGFVSLPLSGEEISSEAVVAAMRAQLAGPLARHLHADGLSLHDATAWTSRRRWESCRHRRAGSCAGAALDMSVVVCTRDRPSMIGACLESLQRLDYATFEVVVVDNAPSNEATRDHFDRCVGDDPRFRYVREAVPGLSRARNRGLAEARARYVAFTDDDVHVDRQWLRAVADAFTGNRSAGCVTGLVAPAELDTPAQHYFDRRFSWASRTDSRVYSLPDRDGLSSLYPYSAGLFGTGANFAVDRELMEGIGGFDEALGAGSPARGGEELDAFVRILRAGRSVAYEPSAVVWHVHRCDARALRRQLFAYGEGLTAFLTKYLVDWPTTRDIVHRVPDGTRQVLKMWGPAAIPATSVKTRRAGAPPLAAAGPLAYARGRRHE